jgi:hypothetical protein
VLRNPNFYDPDRPVPAELLANASESKLSIYTLDPRFRISRNVQAALGVDRSLGKIGSLNLNYLFTRGVHQYYTNNVNAPFFDPETYTLPSSTVAPDGSDLLPAQPAPQTRETSPAFSQAAVPPR